MSRGRKTIDLPRVRASLARLDAHQAEHPEAFRGRTAKQWTSILQEEENMQRSKQSAHDGAEDTIQIAVRLSATFVDRIDAYARTCGKPGMVATRSDAIRILLNLALDAGDREPAKA